MIAIPNPRRLPLRWIGRLIVAASAVAVAVEPALWLDETWADPAYDSAGGHLLVVVLVLAAWSASSSPLDDDPPSIEIWRYAAATLLLRLAGHVLAIPLIGALVLVVDFYVLARLARLGRRRRALSPFWLTVLVGCTLPVEYVLKHLVGFGLQHLAADGACSLLGLFYSDLTCGGLDIVLHGRELFVALSCSGARTLLFFFILFAGLSALVRPSFRQGVAGIGLAAIAGFVVNSLRIALLAAGLAHEASLGFDVMRHRWHVAVGLAALPVGFIPLSIWALGVSGSDPEPAGHKGNPRPPRPARSDDGAPVDRPTARVLAGLALVAAAVAIPATPIHPVGAAEAPVTVELPDELLGRLERPQPLEPIEREYFDRAGGRAARASYGPHELLVVETSTPLRHLRDPNEWLGDADYAVEPLGRTDGRLPAISWRVEAPNGRVWRLDVTFVSERGRTTKSVAEATWYWLQAPTTNWRAIHRFHPLAASPSRVATFDHRIAEFLEQTDRIDPEHSKFDPEARSSTPFHSTRTKRSNP